MDYYAYPGSSLRVKSVSFGGPILEARLQVVHLVVLMNGNTNRYKCFIGCHYDARGICPHGESNLHIMNDARADEFRNTTTRNC